MKEILKHVVAVCLLSAACLLVSAAFVAASAIFAPAEPPPILQGPTLAIDVHFSPQGGCTEEVVRQIGRAKKSIRLLAYNFTSAPVRDALLVAKARGVDVRCVVDHVAASERGCIRQVLLNAAIPCRLDKKHKIMHNKVVVIDAEVVLTGSFNFSDSAEEHNAENLLTIRNAELAKRYRANWLLHWEHSEE